MKNIIQIDLGTAITKVMLNGTIEKNIPTVVGFQTKNDRINTAIGYEAEQPLFQEVFPLKHGVIADYDALKCFVKSLRRMVCRSLPLYRWFLPTHYTFLFHADATSQEEKLLRNVIRQAGIKHFSIANTSSLFLCENQIILDLGAGVSSAMLFQDGVMTDVVSENFGGDDLTEEIQQYVLSHCDCLIGTKSAENIKKSCRKQQQIKGLDSLTKIPKTVEIQASDLQKMCNDYSMHIAKLMNQLQAAHPDALVTELGLSGGASQLAGLKDFLGQTIHFPNTRKEPTTMDNRTFKSLLQSEAWKKATAILPIAVYDAETEQPVIFDLATMPHLLIGGVVGSGKSVFLDTIITGLTSRMSIENLQFVIGDCKITEFDKYRDMPYLMKPVLNAPHEILTTLEMMQEIISTRYQMLANAELANIKDYHDKHLSGMPYVIIILSAFEDCMRNDSEMAKKMDQVIAQLAQRGRGVGVHLILSTSAIRRDVIPSLMRSQIPARIAFLQFDANASRLLLDQDGAENLSRNGEMLYRDGTGTIHRFQTYYLSEEEPYFS